MPIRTLSDEVASRIAAGEVVERPASVVKELVENSLDAGASRVEVETQDGGATLIRVRDNGTGIPAAEIDLAFRRHATSKLENADDLEQIATLGFRGEALSSIAAVSRTLCITRHTAETVGTRLRLEGGEVVAHDPIGRPAGTELVIEDLFYSVPARRKFLRTARTERRHIDAFLTRYAIAYPHTAFTVVHDGREVLATSGSGDARDVLLSVYGADLGASLLQIPEHLTAGQAISVRGFVGPTTVHRADRSYLTLFVNGRWIEDLRLSYAIIQAYHTLLPVKRYPVAFVQIEVPAEDVDVNVHPAKAEVRFRDSDVVFRAVQKAARATVVSEAPVSTQWTSSESDSTGPQQTARGKLAGLRPAQGHIRFGADEAQSDEHSPAASTLSTASHSPPHPPSQLPPLRIVGQLATMFVITEGPDGLYLIDQHAAHERVLYEKLHAQSAQGQVASQPLLAPQSVTLPADQADRLEPLLPKLAELGLQVEAFGPNAFLVRAVPALLEKLVPADLLADIAAATEGTSPISDELEEAVIRHICKRAAVKAGQVLSREEMARLVDDLERTRNPRTCPHGRPTIVQISTEELARHFGRTGH